MAYADLREALDDLARTGQLRRVTEEVDPYLEMAEIQRRVHAAQGPALLFTRVKGTDFPCASNIYGTRDRTRYLFRNTLEPIKALLGLKQDPLAWIRSPGAHAGIPWAALHALPRKTGRGQLDQVTSLSRLPQITSWPKDGGPYITLPQVYSEHPDQPGLRHSNLGMYRIQMSGGEYQAEKEVGLHYQIHRGLGGHHHAAIARGEKLKVSIFVGGPPAHALAAVMPLPEGMPEIYFAGLLGGRRFRYTRENGHMLSTDADFVITGSIDPARTLPEGPFGDHLGYYSLAHPFPVMDVECVYHRRGAIWPFTVVGRPPQEDSHLSELIHELAGPVVPAEIPGVHTVHAVEAAGVHPLLLALAAERYVPYAPRRPRELLTHANAILGFGQLSLAKYLLIAAQEDQRGLDIRDVAAVLRHVLERADWRHDLHFQTRTTMDTLDYSGTGLNAGSKLVVAVAGPKLRDLALDIPSALAGSLPPGFSEPRMALPGVAVVSAPPYRDPASGLADAMRLVSALENAFPDSLAAASTGGNGTGAVGTEKGLSGISLIVLVDNSAFAAKNLDNFLWTTFTRSNPARDIQGLGAFTEDKHWGCRGSMVIDARIKPHHAPPLETDPDVDKRVDALAAPGKSLHGLY